MSSNSSQGPSYRQLAPSGKVCGKKSSRDWPRRCYKYNVITRSSCEADCDQHSWCIAYSHRESKKACNLFALGDFGSCPTAYKLKNGPSLTSIDQITGVNSKESSGCYGKFAGRNKICI